MAGAYRVTKSLFRQLSMASMNPDGAPADRKPISRRLLVQLRIFGVIFLVMLGVLIYDVARGQLSVGTGAGGLALGLVLGVLVSRMYRLSYDEEEGQVAGRIDWVGGVILLLYVTFAFFRNTLFGPWVDAAQLAGFGLSVSAGTMLGRLVGTRRGIRRVLEAWGLRGGASVSAS